MKGAFLSYCAVHTHTHYIRGPGWHRGLLFRFQSGGYCTYVLDIMQVIVPHYLFSLRWLAFGDSLLRRPGKGGSEHIWCLSLLTHISRRRPLRGAERE